jgi:hypothetical protein
VHQEATIPIEDVHQRGRTCADLDDLRTAARAFVERYNTQWLIERHGHRTPREAYTIVAKKLSRKPGPVQVKSVYHHLVPVVASYCIAQLRQAGRGHIAQVPQPEGADFCVVLPPLLLCS